MFDIEKMKRYGVDIINYLSIELLEQFNVYEPSQEQIDAVESFILNVICRGKFITHENLTRREADCLYWAAKGKSSKETANILCISKDTVESYRKKIKQKFNCNSIAEAVFQGLRYVYLSPNN